MGIFDIFKKKEKEEVPSRITMNFDFFSIVGKNGDGIAQKIVEYFGDDVESAFDTHKNFVDEELLSYFEDGDVEKEIPIQNSTKFFTIKLKNGTEINGEIDDSEEARKYGPGLNNHFSDTNIKDENLKEMLLIQIMFFNCMTRLKVTFDYYEKGKNKKENGKLLDYISGAGKNFDGYLMFDVKTMYSPDKKIFISKTMGTDFKEFTPSIPVELVDNFEMTEEDEKRMQKNIEKIKKENLPYLDKMHVSISEKDATLPEKELIIKRAVAMLMTGIASEIYNEFGNNSEEARAGINNFIEKFEEKYGFKEILNEKEKVYLETYIEDDRIHNEYNWRYECPPVFLWVLSLEEMTELDTICNFRETIEFMMNNNMESLLEKSKLRTKDEIMDMLDYLYRLNWSAVNIRIHPEITENHAFPYNESIIHFRRLALEWLVQSEKDIDDVESELHT